MDLERVVAEWYLGLYPPEKMPALAVWALEHGFDGKALIELAGLGTATRKNQQVLIERALRELGTESPSDSTTAGIKLAIRICEQIVSGTISPFDGASRIWTISTCCGWPAALHPFVGFASEWETAPHHYDQLIVAAAGKLLGCPTHTATVRFFLTEKEFEEANVLRRTWITNRYFLIAARIFCCCAAIFFLGLIYWKGETPTHLLRTAPVTAVGLFIMIAAQLSVALGLNEAKVWNRLVNRFDQEREITIDKDTVKIARGPKTWRKKWKDFACFYESPSIFVLQTHGTQFWTIPKRAFEPGVEPIFYHLMASELRRK